MTSSAARPEGLDIDSVAVPSGWGGLTPWIVMKWSAAVATRYCGLEALTEESGRALGSLDGRERARDNTLPRGYFVFASAPSSGCAVGGGAKPGGV